MMLGSCRLKRQKGCISQQRAVYGEMCSKCASVPAFVYHPYSKDSQVHPCVTMVTQCVSLTFLSTSGVPHSACLGATLGCEGSTIWQSPYKDNGLKASKHPQSLKWYDSIIAPDFPSTPLALCWEKLGCYAHRAARDRLFSLCW